MVTIRVVITLLVIQSLSLFRLTRTFCVIPSNMRMLTQQKKNHAVVSTRRRGGGGGDYYYYYSLSSVVVLYMNWFQKALDNAFSNERFSAPPQGVRATARHILVATPEDCDLAMAQLRSGISFATVAREFSTCPSKAQGGSLGSFSPGIMVPEFDKVIFDPQTPLSEVIGPVQTQFGYHLIVVDKRTGV